MSRDFDLGDVLSITTGKLVSPRLIAGVYDILNFMTGDNLYTHQLGRAMAECRPHLLRQHPQLADVTGDDVTQEPDQPGAWRAWLREQKARFGATLPVAPIPADDHARRDPLAELDDMVGPERIIVVDPGSTPDPAAGG